MDWIVQWFIVGLVYYWACGRRFLLAQSILSIFFRRYFRYSISIKLAKSVWERRLPDPSSTHCSSKMILAWFLWTLPLSDLNMPKDCDSQKRSKDDEEVRRLDTCIVSVRFSISLFFINSRPFCASSSFCTLRLFFCLCDLLMMRFLIMFLQAIVLMPYQIIVLRL